MPSRIPDWHPGELRAMCVSTLREEVNRMRAISRKDIDGVEAELERLPRLNRDQVDARWRELLGTERPRRIYGELLIGVLAYRLQEKALGGLKPAIRRLLRQVAGNPGERRAFDALSQPRLKAGAVLLREWHGTTHRVTVLEHGYEYRGQRFKSLSEIARRLTGSRWSGPLFFGLKSSRKEQSSEAA